MKMRDNENAENIIRDISKIIIGVTSNVKVGDKVNDIFADIAFNMYSEGYRKADEVKKQTARDIADWLERNEYPDRNLLHNVAQAIRIIWRVEVDE